MAFLDFSEPVEIIIDRYFSRKRLFSENFSSDSGDFSAASLLRAEAQDSGLPQIPCTIFRGSDGLPVRFVYGEISLLGSADEADPVIWQEELVRDSNGLVSQIITTFPNGHSVTTQILRSGGLISAYDYL